MLFNYLFIFMIGSILGFFLELFYRKIHCKKWIKPGVFNGCYLPLYGIGLALSYLIYNLNVNVFAQFVLSVVFLTFIELICGVIFIKCFKIPLWDYSNKFLNYKGLICLEFSLAWGVLSLIFILLVFPHINFGLLIYSFEQSMYLFYAFFIMDCIYTSLKIFCKHD